MKKAIRLIAVAVVAVMLTLTLCSCDLIDEKRARHAKWIKTGDSFEFDGETYRLIPGEKSTALVLTGYGRITEADVPVLLSEARLCSASFSYNKGNGVATIGQALYATEKNYEYVKKNMHSSDHSFTYYGARQTVYSKNGSMAQTRFFVVDNELRNAITNLLDRIEADPEDYKTEVSSAYCYFELSRCDQKGVFTTSKNTIAVYKAGVSYFFKFNNKLGMYRVDLATREQLNRFVDTMNQEGARLVK